MQNIDTRQNKQEGYYGTYGRQQARDIARASGASSYTTDGGTRTYDLSGNLISKQASSSYVPFDTYKSGISSSSMTRDDLSKSRAMDNANRELYDGTSTSTKDKINVSTDSEVSNFFSSISGNNKDYTKFVTNDLQSGLDMIERVYDTALARTDMEYGNLMEDIKTSQKKAVEVATSNAISLNPYSQARGAQTAANFNNAINTEYAQQAQRATSLYQQAQRELANGRVESAMKLKQQARQDLMTSNEKFQSQLMDIYKQSKEEEQFSIQQESKYQDDFIEALSNLPLTDGGEVDPTQFSMIFDLGKKIGLDDKEIESYISKSANLQGIELKEKELDRLYKQAAIYNMYSKGDDDGGKDRFTQSQINSGVSRSGLATPSFLKLPEDVQNFYITMSSTESQKLAGYLKEIENGQSSSQEVKEIIDYDFADASEEVKNYLYEAVDNSIPVSGGVEDTTSAWGNFWDSVKSTFK
jgi:hypothetical protein